MARNYRYISADSHFESPPEQWTHRVAASYRNRAPRRIKVANGHDAVLLEGSPLMYGGTSLYGGRTPEEFDPLFSISTERPAAVRHSKGYVSRTKTASMQKFCLRFLSAIQL